MSEEGFVQVAVDSTGKKVRMAKRLDLQGNVVYVQMAVLDEPTDELLSQTLAVQRQQLAVFRAILQVLKETSNSQVTEEDFTFGQE